MSVRKLSREAFLESCDPATASRLAVDFRSLVESSPAVDHLLVTETDEEFAGMVVSRVGPTIFLASPPLASSPLGEEKLLTRYREPQDSALALLLASPDWQPATSASRSQWNPVTEMLRYELSLLPLETSLAQAHESNWEVVATENSEILATLAEISGKTEDCPELEAALSWPDRLADYRASAAPNPVQFGLLRRQGRSVGVAVWSHLPNVKKMEVKYWGIAPEFRRQGWGKRLWKSILLTGKSLHAERLIFDVDSRNVAAIRIYQSCGAKAIDRFRLWKTSGECGFSTDYTHERK
ncbi:MAG: GNAT family N-acetyltransferase [Planctomycetaceae bacterium]|nr:GNAT family N-acetyltransferase [Planctomycetaceae bacterium]